VLERTETLIAQDGKLACLKGLLGKQLKHQKVLIFTSFKDTARYLERRLKDETNQAWHRSAGSPNLRASTRQPPERAGTHSGLLRPNRQRRRRAAGEGIDMLISNGRTLRGQNLQDCGNIINYDLTWNPVRLVQRNGRIDRIGSPHSRIGIYNLFPRTNWRPCCIWSSGSRSASPPSTTWACSTPASSGKSSTPARSTRSGASGRGRVGAR